MAIELTKVTINDPDMSDPADIRSVYAEMKTLANAINLIIDKIEEQDGYLDKAVYYEEEE